MKAGRLIALAGAAIVAASSPLVAGASAASAAAVPKDLTYNQTFASGTGCQGVAEVNEEHAINGAYVWAVMSSDPCGYTIEAVIEGPSKSPFSAGNPVSEIGVDTITGYIPINSGNHHGIRWEPTSCTGSGSCWTYDWHD
jgi:anaerobic selenocysteine-containing dehydrogenase